MRTGRSPTPAALRFWPKVKKGDGCWEWQAQCHLNGYGQFWVNESKRMMPAHRYSWQIHNGPIPEGLCVLHTCDNPPCIRPDHLWLGTQADNAADRVSKGRSGNRWHKLTAEDATAIRRRFEAGERSRPLGAEYGINPATVYNIVARRIWKRAP